LLTKSSVRLYIVYIYVFIYYNEEGEEEDDEEGGEGVGRNGADGEEADE
jgi:hypothetical protein